MKKFTCFILTLLMFSAVFGLSSCGSTSLKDTLYENRTWETETDENGSSIRWEFTSKNVKYVNVFQGEDTFSQTFTLSIEGNTLIFTSDYAKLTFVAEVNGDTMTATSETGSVLVFKKK